MLLLLKEGLLHLNEPTLFFPLVCSYQVKLICPYRHSFDLEFLTPGHAARSLLAIFTAKGGNLVIVPFKPIIRFSLSHRHSRARPPVSKRIRRALLVHRLMSRRTNHDVSVPRRGLGHLRLATLR